MTSTEGVVAAARALAERAHQGQVDKAGRPYIRHPEAVADRLAIADGVGRTVAWLHDVVEDTDVTLDQVRDQFGPVVADAVDAITHRRDEPRDDYYERVKMSFVALRVKGADLATNTDPWRTRLLEPELRARLAAKYAHAYEALELPAPDSLLPQGRIVVTVGDVARRGQDEVMVAWVGQGPDDVVAVFTDCQDGQFRGTAALPGLLAYHGVWDDAVHLFSLPGDWRVSDPQWDL